MLSSAFEMNVAVAILRVQEGLDYTGILADIDDLLLDKNPPKKNKMRKQEELANELSKSLTRYSEGENIVSIYNLKTYLANTSSTSSANPVEETEAPVHVIMRSTSVRASQKGKKEKKKEKQAVNLR